MPLFFAALIGALVSAAGSIAGRALVSLGFGAVVYTGVNASITWARDYAVAHVLAAGSSVVQIAGVLHVGVCISMLVGAITSRLLINGLTNGALKKFGMK
jgi:hypothetical protein